MLTSTPQGHQISFFGEDLINQLDPHDPLVLLAQAIPWQHLEETLSAGYTFQKGRPSIEVSGCIRSLQEACER